MSGPNLVAPGWAVYGQMKNQAARMAAKQDALKNQPAVPGEQAVQMVGATLDQVARMTGAKKGFSFSDVEHSDVKYVSSRDKHVHAEKLKAGLIPVASEPVPDHALNNRKKFNPNSKF